MLLVLPSPGTSKADAGMSRLRDSDHWRLQVLSGITEAPNTCIAAVRENSTDKHAVKSAQMHVCSEEFKKLYAIYLPSIWGCCCRGL
jgi:hypothetical protein